MKILFCQIIRGLSGSEKYFIEIMPLLKAQGIDCEFLCVSMQQDGEIYRNVTDKLQTAGIKVHFIQTAKQLNYSLLKNIHQIIKTGNYKLLHAHLIHAEIWFVLVKKLFGLPHKIVSTKHGFNDDFTAVHGFNPTKKLYNAHYFASLFTEKFIHRSFAVSEGIRKLYIGAKISKSEKIDTIYYGFEQKSGYAQQAKPIKKSHLDLIIAGRLVAYKGHEFVLRALPKVVQAVGTEVRLQLVGKGVYEPTLRALCEQLNINDYVQFVGYSNEVMKLVHQADLMLIPSKSEGFGIVFLEAFEAKTPVIAFDVPACNEIIDNGKNGYLVAPYNVEELAEKMIDLLQNPNKRTQFAQAAFQTLNTVFTPQNMVTKTLQFYQKAMKD